MKKGNKIFSKKEVEKYEEISKMVDKAHKEVIRYVKKNLAADPRLQIDC